MIIGRRLAQLELDRAGRERRDSTAIAVDGPDRDEARGLSLRGPHAGEVLGVTGLLGSGFDERPLPAVRRAPVRRRRAAHRATRRTRCRR